MPIPRLPRPSMRRSCLCTFVTALLAAIVVFDLVIFNLALPMRRAHYLELDYQRKLIAAQSTTQDGVPTSVQPLIENVEQLFFWTDPATQFRTYDSSLGLNFDGTAKPQSDSTWYGHGDEMWIYLAGTAPDAAPQPNAYTHKWKNPDCDDPAHICDSHLEAFRRIAKRWPTSKFWGPNGITARVQLRWADCDVSPMLCDTFWGLAGANLLVHMKVGTDCDYSMIVTGSCPVEWRWIGLPIYQAPWTRQIRIPLDAGGSTVVPAFPSAEEQMWNIMSYPDALDVLEYEDWNSLTTVTPQPDKPPVIEGGFIEPLGTWGGFRAWMDNPYRLPEWPFELEIKCYAERYVDMLLGWWDEAADLVQLRNCTGVAEARRQEWQAQDDMWDKWKAREVQDYKKRWDEMMEKTFADIEKWQKGELKDEELWNDADDETDEEE